MIPDSITLFPGQFTSVSLECVNWPSFSYCPEVKASLSFDDSSVRIRFDVAEDHVLATETSDNHPVCVDSCVEAFIMTADGRNYINFECNPLGTLLAARRATRKEKSPLCPEELALVRRRGSHVGASPFELRQSGGSPQLWWLEMEIPFSLLGYTGRPDSLRFNLYKCGDRTDRPHYLSLFPVLSDKPDFHRPEYFGDMLFC